MYSTSCRITPRLLKKIFFLVCISCVFLLGFYLYYEKYDALLEFARLQVRLRSQTFHNVSRAHQPDFCLSEQTEVTTALIFVISDSHHRFRRQIIRSSWAHHRVLTNLHFGVLFVVDDINDTQVLTQNSLESAMFGDLIRVNHTESNSYNIQKTMLSFQWALKNCPTVKFIIKTDDDIFINPFALHKLLKWLSPPSPGVSSNTNQLAQLNIKGALDFSLFEQSLQETSTDDDGLTPIRQDTRDLKFVIPRHIDPKNFLFNKISESVYNTQLENYDADDRRYESSIPPVNRDRTLVCSVWKNTTLIEDAHVKLDAGKGDSKEEDVYQTSCIGGAYIVPIFAVRLLVEAQLKKLPSKILPSEDIYITGILAKEAGLHHFQISTRYAFKSINTETIVSGNIIFAHLGKGVEILTSTVWNLIVENHENNEF